MVNRILLGGVMRDLCVAIDASISPGTTGGPVINQSGQLVGMASAAVQHSQSTGYILPLPVLHSFLHNAGFYSSGNAQRGSTSQSPSLLIRGL